uniref:Carbohydrate sulfotransferase n=1 Tax=Chaetoceros debilis TaxID=122233 RepID=A0A7S3Q9I0_9STRA
MTRSLLRMKRLYAPIAVLAVVSALSILAPAGMVHTQTRDLLEGASGTVDDDDDATDNQESNGLPVLKATDIIIRPGRSGNPIVIEEYKLVFFFIPKVACTEWKLLFRRILGFSPDWDPEIAIQKLHNPAYNGLTYLSSYTKEEAQEMLTSEDWTRAVFVREPKERILSAFLDKMVVNSWYFKHFCCNEKQMGMSDPKARDYCNSRENAEDFPYFLKRTLDCPNEHWDSQANAIDRKWWTMMNFVGYMDNVADDAQRLLQSIKSIDGKTAWDQHGKTGWGESGKSAFMVRDTAHHATNAHDKLRKYYTECEEVFVEKHWASEWEQEAYHFDKIQLFDGKDLSGCFEMRI